MIASRVQGTFHRKPDFVSPVPSGPGRTLTMSCEVLAKPRREAGGAGTDVQTGCPHPRPQRGWALLTASSTCLRPAMQHAVLAGVHTCHSLAGGPRCITEIRRRFAEGLAGIFPLLQLWKAISAPQPPGGSAGGHGIDFRRKEKNEPAGVQVGLPMGISVSVLFSSLAPEGSCVSKCPSMQRRHGSAQGSPSCPAGRSW